MKLIPKHQNVWQTLQPDNTVIAKPTIDYRVKYKLKPGEFFYTDKSGKKHVGKSKEATVSQDNMTKQQKKEADVKKKIAEQQEKEQKLNEGAEQLFGVTKLLFPSTYVGPLFRDNGKSYTENLLSGEGTGNIAGNLVIDALLPYSITKGITSGTRYTGQVASRYKFANQNLASADQIQQEIQKLNYIQNGKSFQSKPMIKTISNGIVTRNGAITITPGKTTELHLDPAAIGDLKTKTVLEIKPEPELSKEAIRLLKSLPQHTVLTSNSAAKAIPQIIPRHSLKTRVNYYLTGAIPKTTKVPIDGYSTDIMQLFKYKGLGEVTPSLTTELEGFNIFGKNYSKFSKYFGYPDKNGYLKFSDMTPEQIESWNTEVAPIYGHYINPDTRTSEHLMLITK